MNERGDTLENEPAPTLGALLVISIPWIVAPFLSRFLHHHFGMGASLGLMLLFLVPGSLLAMWTLRALWPTPRRLVRPSGRRLALTIGLVAVVSIAAELFSGWVDHHLY